MKDNEKFSYIAKEEEKFNFKKVVFLVRRQWKWVLLFGTLGIMGAYGYTKLTKPSYEVNTTVLIPEKTNGLNVEEIFNGAIESPRNNIYNQIEIIRSYYTVSKTLLNLNWRTSWYAKDMFIWKGIYKKEPFDVQEPQNYLNPRGIPIYITPTSENNYIVSVKGLTTYNNASVEIDLEEEGQYGRPFISKHFNFTLLKKINDHTTIKGKFYFVFNDLNDMTIAYQNRLKAYLKDKKSDIIVCSIIGEQPDKECEFLNELTDVYTEGKMDFQNESQRRSLDFINTQLAGIADSLNTAGTKFSEFRSKNSIIDLGAEGTMVMNNLKELETEEARSQMQLNYFQNLLDYLNSSSDFKHVSPSVVGIEDAALNALVLKLGDLYNRRQVISFSANDNNPTLVMIDKEINQIRRQLSENLQNLIDNARKNIENQRERQNKIAGQMNKLPQKEQEMVNIQRQFNLTNEIYTFLLQKRAETNIALASSIPDVQVVEMARPQMASLIGLGRMKIMLIGLLLGIGLPMAYVILLHYFDDRIYTQSDLENNTSIPILGNIMHSVLNSETAVFDFPKSNIAESFRVVRTNLQFMTTGSKGKVISIHSSNPGEGKSYTSTNLACILAMNNKKVLLIGADMRKPKLHKTFKISNEKGLSTYLIDLNTYDEIVLPTNVENLYLLPSGPIPPNPAEILGKTEMKTLLDTARTEFDFIIIDNAPTSLVTDGQIVSHLSDLNVFILRYGVSHINEIEMFNQFVEENTIPNIAIIVNDIKINSFGRTYYKYYQYETYQNKYYSDEEEDKKYKHKKKAPNFDNAKMRV